MPRPQRRKLVQAIKATVPVQPQFRRVNYTVASVVASGATTDGKPGVFVNVGTDVVQMVYLDTVLLAGAFAPGQTVTVEYAGSSPMIVGRPAGLPSF